MLKDEGMDVKLEQAEEILYFLYKLSNIQLIHYLKKIISRKKYRLSQFSFTPQL